MAPFREDEHVRLGFLKPIVEPCGYIGQNMPKSSKFEVLPAGYFLARFTVQATIMPQAEIMARMKFQV